jgi:phenylalanine-4-hydroxylase
MALDHAMIDDDQARHAQHYADCFGKPSFLDPEELFIDQCYEGYTDEHRATWCALFERQQGYLEEHASAVYLAGARAIRLSAHCIPQLEEVSARIRPMTGWESRAVPGYLPARAFFACVARRQFPTTIVLRPRESLGYLPEPDIFHDVYGHVPLHADPDFAAFLQAYGAAALRATDPAHVERMARLFWFTVEFGLVHEDGRTRLYGSGLLSSPDEARHALESSEVVLAPFDLERVLATTFEIDHYQPLLFVLDDFAQLRAAMESYAATIG